MSVINRPNFVDFQGVSNAPERYVSMDVDTKKVLESWKKSLFSFEWLDGDGNFKDVSALKPIDAQRFNEVHEALKAGKPLEKPVLGLGVMDNVEIGVGREIFLTLAALGVGVISVHILRSHEKDFQAYRLK
ncbi:MAG: hypothetical protein KTR28_04505 [Micavibrio sp.]|nr:hypothetical protein [Micavibrio sp.]